MNIRKIASARFGFTLFETLTAIAIFLIVASIAAAYIASGFRANQFIQELSDAIGFAKRGIQTMEKEIREAVYAENGNYPVVEAQDSSFKFYSDIDSDDSVELVRYYLSGNDLVKSVTEPAQTIPVTYPPANEATSTIAQFIQNTSTPVFYYYNGDYPADAAGNPLATPADVNAIKLVRLYLIVNVNPLKAPDDFILETFVQLRNLKNNL